jgi:hypothetical protein
LSTPVNSPPLQSLKKQKNSNDEIEKDEKYQEFFATLRSTIVKSGDSKRLAALKMYSKNIWMLKLSDENEMNRERPSSSTATSSSTIVLPEEDCLPDKTNNTENHTLKQLFVTELDKTYLFDGT